MGMSKPKKTDTVSVIAALKPARRWGNREMLTDAEAEQMIKAIRKGVATTSIDDATGKAHGSTYTRLGRWAMRRCRCFAEAQEE